MRRSTGGARYRGVAVAGRKLAAMQRLRMVAVARVGDGFHARVLAARLGSEGIVTQLRGGGLDGPYPMGDVEVLVGASDLGAARELLLADEVESAFDTVSADDFETVPVRMGPATWVVVVVIAVLVLFAYVNTLAFAPPARGSAQQAGDGHLVEAAEGSAVLAAG